MTTPQSSARPFPELEWLKETALAYAWSMLCLGIGAGFVLAWLMCSMRSCQPPREPVDPCPMAPAPQSAGSTSCRNPVRLTPSAVPSGPSRFRSSDAG